MFIAIARFELRYQLRNPVFWLTVAFLFLLTFAGMTVENVRIGGAGGNVHRNAPFAVISVQAIFSIFYMFVTTAFVANVVVRDDDTGFGPIVRSTRIIKANYLYGRFAGALVASAIAFMVVPLAIWIGSLMPWVDRETLGPNLLAGYAFGYFVLALPTIGLTSAIFFALATATRSMMATYLGVLFFLIMNLAISAALSNTPEWETVSAILEPFGAGAYQLSTKYWTVADRNTLVPAFSGVLLWNRLLWLGIAGAFLASAYALYDFADKGISKRALRKQMASRTAAEIPIDPVERTAVLPTPRFGRSATIAQLTARTRFEMKLVFKSPAFAILLIFGTANCAATLFGRANLFGTPTLPVTHVLIPLLIGSFGVIPVIIAVYYSGELVWRERDRKVHEIIDATPLPNWGYVVPKTIAVTLVLTAAVVISVLVGMLVQILGGTPIEFEKDVTWYVIPIAFQMSLIAILAIFIQALSPNKYVGWGIMVLYLILQTVGQLAGLEHDLYLYGKAPSVPLSGMNGQGIYATAAWWFRLYWAAFAMLLLVAAHLLWRRGTDTRLVPRLRRAWGRLSGTSGWIAGVSLLVVTSTGGWIYYNTNVLNEYRTMATTERFLANYEKKYIRYAGLAQPTISRVKLEVALYPDQVRAETRGTYWLSNLTDQAIRDVHIRRGDTSMELLNVVFPGARLVSDDESFGYRIYRLDRPMAPGETRQIGFQTRRQQRGIRDAEADTRLVPNGTFLNNRELAPTIGMSRDFGLQDRAARRKYGLPPELRPAKLEDFSAIDKNYIGAGWSTADITVSTVAGQTPIAPGKKVSDVTRGGRRTARFVSEAPILTFFSIQSARYAERHRTYKGIDLAIYYHPPHTWNVNRMLDAMETALDYYQANFGLYQFDQARIIEFPGYAPYAQAFANTIPYSESIGFIADTRDPSRIDYVTYVTAHELAHQWWAHQMIGADMQGAQMLSETLAQYSALMVMKHLYGEDKIRRFLKYELDTYLAQRGGDPIGEQPLERVENQQYIQYNKGSLVTYLLQDRLGEARVNIMLRALLTRHRFKGAPYARSTELVDGYLFLARSTGERQLILDLLTRITLYDLRAKAAISRRLPNGRWETTIVVDAAKAYADGQGIERRVPLADEIDVGVFTSRPGSLAFDRANVLAMERRPIRSGVQSIRIVTTGRPSFAGIDPYNKYIDRNSDDNLVAIAGI